MNDTELDRLLDSWEAPEPPPSLRSGLRARFPRTERRSLNRPLRWMVAIAVASAALAVGTEQNADSLADSHIVRLLSQFWEQITETLEAHRVMALVWRVRHSDARTLVDGKPGAALQFRHSARFDLEIPGDGTYAVTFGAMVRTDWVQAGHMRGNTMDFRAGAHRIVIQFSSSLTDTDTPVFVRREQ